MINLIFRKLAERTTWLGLVNLAAAAGLTLSENVSAALVGAGVAIAGLVLVVMKEKK